MSPVHHHTSPVHHFTSPPLLVHSLFSVRTNNARNSHGSPLNNESSSHGSPLRQAQLSQNNLRHKALEEHIHEVGVEVPQAIMPNPLFDITKSFYLSVHDHERCSVNDLVWLAQEAIESMQPTFWRITRHVGAVAHLLQQFRGLERHVMPFDMLIQVGITRLDDGRDPTAERNTYIAPTPTQPKYLPREVRRKRIWDYHPPLPRLR